MFCYEPEGREFEFPRVAQSFPNHSLTLLLQLQLRLSLIFYGYYGQLALQTNFEALLTESGEHAPQDRIRE